MSGLVFKTSDSNKVIIAVGDSASPEAFTAIGNVLSASGPSPTRTSLDMTDADTTGNNKEFRGGQVDPGELTFDIHFQPKVATHGDTGTGLMKLLDDEALRNFRFTWPDDSPQTTATFAGFVMNGPTPTGEIDGKITASCTIKISGDITWA